MNAPHELGSVLAPRWRDAGFMLAMGPAFHTRLPAQPLPDVHWVARSWALAGELELAEWLHYDSALAMLAGNVTSTQGTALASVYSGHQFGVWAGQLGDGRALLLGEIDSPLGAQEIQIKGSGLTPYSRMGDGRAVLRSSIREFLCSEAMHHLGIPTTRALAVIGSPAPVRRETVETAAVVTRVAPSFLRFGHFEHFAHTASDGEALRRLSDAVIDRFFPECRDAQLPVLAWLEAVARRTARLVADWQAVGFCHGVMNTDNMSILGLTIDYGPFGFLDAFDPAHVCNHSDHQGRYAFANQPSVAFWNLHALAQALMPLIGDDVEALRAALEPYKDEFSRAIQQRLRAKLGLRAEQDGDAQLIDDLLKQMSSAGADYTITMRRLCAFDSASTALNAPVRDLFIDRPAFDAWADRYRARLAQEPGDDAERGLRMKRVNPKYILRNHLAEDAIRAARDGDFTATQRLLQVLEHPFDEQPEHEAYAGFPPDWARRLEISCSS